MKRFAPVILASLTFGVLAAMSGAARADDYPSRPIRIIVPYGPGAGVDVSARVLVEGLSKEMNANIFVENRDGAGGLIGTLVAAKAAPDGYTLMYNGQTLSEVPLLTKAKTYDPSKDFVGVARVMMAPFAMVASLNAPYKNLKELIAYVKANPGKISYATSGKGSSSHLETALIQQKYGLDMSDVPYKAFGPALTDTIVGRVGFYLSAYAALLPGVKGGQTRMMAYGMAKRSADLPDVPTFAESMDDPNYISAGWYGIEAPAGTPKEIVHLLYTHIAKTMQNPEVLAKTKAIGDEASVSTPEELDAQIKEETVRWTKVVNAIGLDALQ